MRTEREKMLAGEPYLASDSELVRLRTQARRLTRLYNTTREDETELRSNLMRELFGSLGENVWIEPPLHCDYGSNIRLGDGVYVNFGCTILDCSSVRLGSNVKLGPSVQIYAAYHPVLAAERVQGPELSASVTIEDNVWIGGGAIVLPGVTIGANTTIGAGSVVTRDVPSDVVAVGNPCRVVRRL